MKKIKLGHKNLKSKGFTLAEVLITLVIIGIIAAVTVPILYGEYQKEQTVTGLKKAYSEVNQAISMSIAENGSLDGFDFSLTPYEFFKKYLIKFIVISDKKFLQEQQNNNLEYHRISGRALGNSYLIYNTAYDSRIINLASGMQIITHNKNPNFTHINDYESFYVDINGDKKPNTLGKDIFSMIIWREHGLTFHQKCNDDNYETAKSRTREQLKNDSSCDYSCNKSGSGLWCGALIQADGWQIKKDYPW